MLGGHLNSMRKLFDMVGGTAGKDPLPTMTKQFDLAILAFTLLGKGGKKELAALFSIIHAPLAPLLSDKSNQVHLQRKI